MEDLNRHFSKDIQVAKRHMKRCSMSLIVESESHSVMSDSLRPLGLYSLWDFPGQNTGVGSFFLLQGIFPMQGLNPGIPHCRQILYQLSHKGSPRILEWVAYPFSSRSSQPRNQTRISCIAGRFFTGWTIREERNTNQNYNEVSHHTVKMAIIKKPTNNKYGEDERKMEPSYANSENVNWYSDYGEQYGDSLKN